MKKSSTVLTNLLSHFPRNDFEKAVREHGGDKKVRSLCCYDFFRALAFGQITAAYGVREIEASLESHRSSLYQVGMNPVRRSTLCDALEKRSSMIFEKTFQSLVAKARDLTRMKGRRFKNPLKIVDASTIELCLARFDWAKFRSTKGAVKLHVRLDGDFCYPEQVRLTTGAVHEVTEFENLAGCPGNIYVADRGYVDFKRLYGINLAKSFFVTRLKSNCKYEVVKPLVAEPGCGVTFDAMIKLVSEKGQADYPDDLRLVAYHDEPTNRSYAFLTNIKDTPAKEIADMYKARWQIELFFKWIKQNLRLKTFWGTSQNAVQTQIWVALIVFMLIWISKAVEGITVTCQRIIQVLKTSLFERKTLQRLLADPDPPQKSKGTQLILIGGRN